MPANTTTRVIFDATQPHRIARNSLFAYGLPGDPTRPARRPQPVRLVAGPTRSRLRREAAFEYAECMKEFAALAARR